MLKARFYREITDLFSSYLIYCCLIRSIQKI